MDKPIWKVFEGIMRDVSEEELAKIPPAENLERWPVSAESRIPLGAPHHSQTIENSPLGSLEPLTRALNKSDPPEKLIPSHLDYRVTLSHPRWCFLCEDYTAREVRGKLQCLQCGFIAS